MALISISAISANLHGTLPAAWRPEVPTRGVVLLDFFIMTLAVLCCAFIRWAAVFPIGENRWPAAAVSGGCPPAVAAPRPIMLVLADQAGFAAN